MSPERLGKENIFKLLVKFAVPSVFSLVLHALYNVVDRAFIGQAVGKLALSGVTLCFPILLLIFGVCLLFSSGCASLISIYLGENKKKKAELVLGNTITLITITGVIVTFLGINFYSHILHLFKVPEQVLPYSTAYIEKIFLGTIFFLYGFSMTFIIRAEGNPIYATLMIVVGTVINVILDYFFIIKFSLGTAGAAMATIIAEGFVAAMGIFYIISRRGILHIRLKNLALKLDIVKKISALGASSAVMDVVASIQLIILNERLLFYGGNIAVAAMGIVFAINSVIRLFTFGMAAGMQPIIGYNYGAKKFKRVKQTLKYTTFATSIVSVVFILLILFFAENLSMMFTKDVELIYLSSYAMRIVLSMIVFLNLTIIGGRFFQAIDKPVHSLFVVTFRQVFIFIPALYIFSNIYGLNGIWFAAPFSHLFSFVFVLLFVLVELKKMKEISSL